LCDKLAEIQTGILDHVGPCSVGGMNPEFKRVG